MPGVDKMATFCDKCGRGWTHQPKKCVCGNTTLWSIEVGR